jgi:hypothetical protein
MGDDFGQFQEFLRRGHERAPRLYPRTYDGREPEVKKAEVLPATPPKIPATPEPQKVDFKSRAAGDSEYETAEEVVDESEGTEDF